MASNAFEVIAKINSSTTGSTMFDQPLKTTHTQDGWLQKPMHLSRRTLQTSHPHWSDSELNQVILMLDLLQDKPYGDLGIILA